MKYSPGPMMDFYEESLAALGVLSERPWHDRLEVVAEGPSAMLWNSQGALYAGELHFTALDAGGLRDAAREVFPGCPLTFRLAEALRSTPLSLENFVFVSQDQDRPPETTVTEKLWRSQFPSTSRCRLTSAFKPDFHFSLMALIRCEIQAIDQHWSLHRIALSLTTGQTDENLAQNFAFSQGSPIQDTSPSWPKVDFERWGPGLQLSLERDLALDLDALRLRQEKGLRRELERIDDYFSKYAAELEARVTKTSEGGAKLKIADRLAAAQAEHLRKRAVPLARYEIRVRPHFDALLLVAEPAWRGSIEIEQAGRGGKIEAIFVSRARRWEVKPG